MDWNELTKQMRETDNVLEAAQLYENYLEELADNYEEYDAGDRDKLTRCWIRARVYNVVTNNPDYAELNAALIDFNGAVTTLLVNAYSDVGSEEGVDKALEEIALAKNEVAAAVEGLESRTESDDDEEEEEEAETNTAAARSCFFAWLEGLDLLDSIKKINKRVKDGETGRETNILIENAFDTITRIRRELVNVQSNIGNK